MTDPEETPTEPTDAVDNDRRIDPDTESGEDPGRGDEIDNPDDESGNVSVHVDDVDPDAVEIAPASADDGADAVPDDDGADAVETGNADDPDPADGTPERR